MFLSENNNYCDIKIQLEDEYKFFIKLEIFNSDYELIELPAMLGNSYSFRIKKSVYVLRTYLDGILKDNEVTFDDDKKNYFISISGKKLDDDNIIFIHTGNKLFSSALLDKNIYASSYDYYLSPAIEKSSIGTLKNYENKNYDSSLFIFLRFPSLEKFNEFASNKIYYDFELWYGNYEKIASFDEKECVFSDDKYGYLAFNSNLPKGLYFLIYKGDEKRQIPLYIFEGWHTQIFLTLGKEPLYGTLRMFISKEKKFDPQNIYNKYTDILYNKLQNEEYDLNPEFIKFLANNEIKSPMLYLLASYIYLKSKCGKELFPKLRQRLESLFHLSLYCLPDLLALNILYSSNFENNFILIGTPILRIGFETIKDYSLNNKVIPPYNINDYIAENTYFDSPFNTFKYIIADKYTLINECDSLHDEKFIYAEKSIIEETHFYKDYPKFNEKTSLEDLFLDKKLNINDLKEKSTSWIEYYILDLIEKNSKLNLGEISWNLKVPQSTIYRVSKELISKIKSNIIEFDFKRNNLVENKIVDINKYTKVQRLQGIALGDSDNSIDIYKITHRINFEKISFDMELSIKRPSSSEYELCFNSYPIINNDVKSFIIKNLNLSISSNSIVEYISNNKFIIKETKDEIKFTLSIDASENSLDFFGNRNKINFPEESQELRELKIENYKIHYDLKF